MKPFVRSIAFLLPCILLASAQAQVYRCGDTSTYTDKPCRDARSVDLRSNVMNAGPRMSALPPQVPQAAIILPDTSPKAPPVDGGSSTIYDRKASEDASHANRTGPFTR
jgi:hypothetical protein